MLRVLVLSATISAIVMGARPLVAFACDGERAAEGELDAAPGPELTSVPQGGGEEAPEDDGWRDPDYVLPAAQISLGLTLVGVGYWARNHPPRVGLSTWEDRLTSTEWLILDASPFRINYLQHAGGGAAFHLAARTSHLGLIESAAYNLGASLVWEYIVEYDRKVDLNDLIYTTPSGFALGEFGYALGRLLQQTPSGRTWEAARWTLGLPHSVNYPLRGIDGPCGPDVHHRFWMSTGASRASGRTTRGDEAERDKRGLLQIRLGGRLARIDDPYAAGRGWRRFADGNFTSIDAALTTGAWGDYGNYLVTDTLFAGWRYTDIVEGRARGRAINLGSAMAMRYQSERFGGWRDRFGMAHLPGVAVDGMLWGPRWRLEGVARLHPDYGGIGSLSYGRWADANPAEIGWTSLEDRGYYHALGLSGRLRAELTFPYGSVGAELFGGRYRNHRGRDLNDAELTIEQRVASRFADHDLWLRGAFTSSWFVEARLEGRYRAERFEELDATSRLLRAELGVGAVF